MRLAQRRALASAQASASPAANRAEPSPHLVSHMEGRKGWGFSLGHEGKHMKSFIILMAMLVSSVSFAGSLPTVGPVPTAAGAGVSTHASGAGATTNTRTLSTSTSAGVGNPSATSFGNSAAGTTGNGLVRAPAVALTAASGASGTGAAAAVGAGNVSHGATTKP